MVISVTVTINLNHTGLRICPLRPSRSSAFFLFLPVSFLPPFLLIPPLLLPKIRLWSLWSAVGSQAGSGAELQTKWNYVQYGSKIWHLTTAILVTFTCLRVKVLEKRTPPL